jgi:hypothetical protein
VVAEVHLEAVAQEEAGKKLKIKNVKLKMEREEEKKDEKEEVTLFEIFLRQEIELGLLDSVNGLTQTLDEVRKEFGLVPLGEN